MLAGTGRNQLTHQTSETQIRPKDSIIPGNENLPTPKVDQMENPAFFNIKNQAKVVTPQMKAGLTSSNSVSKINGHEAIYHQPGVTSQGALAPLSQHTQQMEKGQSNEALSYEDKELPQNIATSRKQQMSPLRVVVSSTAKNPEGSLVHRQPTDQDISTPQSPHMMETMKSRNNAQSKSTKSVKSKKNKKGGKDSEEDAARKQLTQA